MAGGQSPGTDQGELVAGDNHEELTQQVGELLRQVKLNRTDRQAWRRLAIAYRQLGDHSHQVWAWSRSVQHLSMNRHCKKWGHLLRFQDSPDHAVCLYCGEAFSLED